MFPWFSENGDSGYQLTACISFRKSHRSLVVVLRPDDDLTRRVDTRLKLERAVSKNRLNKTRSSLRNIFDVDDIVEGIGHAWVDARSTT